VSIKNKLILSAMVALIIIAPIYILNKRASIYSYETDRSYEYSFDQNNAKIVSLSFKNGKVVVPGFDNSHQTAFLKVKVDTTLIGGYFQPCIKISGKESSFTQYLEHGAKGIRYLNISPLLSKTKSEIRLAGNHVAIDDQAVQLISFENQNMKKRKILVIAPHPDDAEIAAYGLYSSNRNSYVLTITAGDSGANKYNEIYKNRVKQYLQKGKLRTWNSITVPLLGGVSLERSINLGFFDATLKYMYHDKSAVVSGRRSHVSDISTFRKQNVSSLANGLSGRADWHSLVANIEYLLKEIKPDIIVTPYPALDRHSDHKLSTIALFDAIKKSGIKSGYLYLYTNHFVLNSFYPYGEMGGVVSLPPNFGSTIYFDSVYSHALTIDKQKDKIFALEAMNDLRLDMEWRTIRGAIKLLVYNIKRDVFGLDYSYYRRAVRSNELFFVVNIADIYNEGDLKKIIGNLE